MRRRELSLGAWVAVLGVLGTALVGGCLREQVNENRDWPCDTSDDCTSNEICIGTDNRHCKPKGACNTVADCPQDSPMICHKSQCAESECNAKFQSMCAPYPCNAISGTCETKCTYYDDCVSTHFCNGSVCVPKCTTNDDCPTMHYCANSACVKACDSGQDCGLDHGVDCGTCTAPEQCCMVLTPSCTAPGVCPN